MPIPSGTGQDIRGLGPNAGKGILYADGISTTGQNSVIGTDLNAVNVLPVYSIIIPAVSLAQLNAGFTILPGIPGRTIKVLKYLEVITGTFLTATDIRLQDTNGAPVLINTLLIAGATAGAKISSEVVNANVTDGPGAFANLTLGAGINLVKTGSAATGGTSILVEVLYNVI